MVLQLPSFAQHWHTKKSILDVDLFSKTPKHRGQKTGSISRSILPTLADERREYHSETRGNKQARGWSEEMLVVTDDLRVSYFLEISQNKSDDVEFSEKLAWYLYSQICFNTDTLDSCRDTTSPSVPLILKVFLFWAVNMWHSHPLSKGENRDFNLCVPFNHSIGKTFCIL